jgi:hypothetical protein
VASQVEILLEEKRMDAMEIGVSLAFVVDEEVLRFVWTRRIVDRVDSRGPQTQLRRLRRLCSVDKLPHPLRGDQSVRKPLAPLAARKGYWTSKEGDSAIPNRGRETHVPVYVARLIEENQNLPAHRQSEDRVEKKDRRPAVGAVRLVKPHADS